MADTMSEEAQRILSGAKALASTKGHDTIEPIHVAHVLFHEDNSVGQRAVNATAVRSHLPRRKLRLRPCKLLVHYRSSARVLSVVSLATNPHRASGTELAHRALSNRFRSKTRSGLTIYRSSAGGRH